MKTYTALVRDKVTGEYHIKRTTECLNMKTFIKELREDGYAVRKVLWEMSVTRQ